MMWPKEPSPICGGPGVGRGWLWGARLGDQLPGCRIAVMPQYCPLPQAVVLEGNYWKRRIEVVMREYHKWRIYYKKRVSGPVPAAPCPSATMVGQDSSIPGAETWLPGSWPPW